MPLPSWLIDFERKLYEKNPINDFLALLEQKSGIPRLQIVLGLSVGVVITSLLGNIGLLICNILGFVYPVIASVKAIESREDPDDDKKWLTYWVVFALIVVFEFFAGPLLFLVPFYTVFKCALLVWLIAPGPNNGALCVYRNLIRPIVMEVDENDVRAILPSEIQKGVSFSPET